MKKRILAVIAFWVISIVVSIFVRDKIVFIMHVEGTSMENTITEEDIIFVSRINSIERGDIVVFMLSNRKIIKRCVAVPGDKIFIWKGDLYVNYELVEEPYVKAEREMEAGLLNKQIILGEDEYIMLGDNRDTSIDSRNFGIIKEEQILGEVIFKIRF